MLWPFDTWDISTYSTSNLSRRTHWIEYSVIYWIGISWIKSHLWANRSRISEIKSSTVRLSSIKASKAPNNFSQHLRNLIIFIILEIYLKFSKASARQLQSLIEMIMNSWSYGVMNAWGCSRIEWLMSQIKVFLRIFWSRFWRKISKEIGVILWLFNHFYGHHSCQRFFQMVILLRESLMMCIVS